MKRLISLQAKASFAFAFACLSAVGHSVSNRQHPQDEIYLDLQTSALWNQCC